VLRASSRAIPASSSSCTRSRSDVFYVTDLAFKASLDFSQLVQQRLFSLPDLLQQAFFGDTKFRSELAQGSAESLVAGNPCVL
jgi:hypothetical protein